MSLIIEVIISVVVIYVIFSVVVYVLMEWIAGLFELRGKMLVHAFNNIFKKAVTPNLVDKILDHPQVKTLSNKPGKLPSYIPANNVAVALIDLVGNASIEDPKVSQDVFTLFKTGIEKEKGSDLGTLLQSITEHTCDLGTLTAALEKWYNNYMDRVTGWYKKQARLISLFIGIAITIAFNVDTLYIVKVASTDPVMRAKLNTLADQLIKDSAFNKTITAIQKENGSYFDEFVNDSSVHQSTVDSLAEIKQQLRSDSTVSMDTDEKTKQLQGISQLIRDWDLPIGWKDGRKGSFWYMILGWFITAVALSFGAPFWFDTLKRLVNVRNAGQKPKDS